MVGQGKTQRVIDSYHGVPCDWIRPDNCPERPGEPCGQIHEHCRGHLKATSPERAHQRGDPCGAHAVEGLLTCVRHGAATKASRAKGARNVAEQNAVNAVNRRLGNAEGTPVTDPGAVLAQAAGRVIAWRDAASALLADLEETVADLTSDEDTPTPGLAVVVPTRTGLDVHPLVKLVERADDRVLKFAADMVKLGFDERRVQIEEAQAAALEAALTAALAEHGIDPGPIMPTLAAKLHAIEATATEAT